MDIEQIRKSAFVAPIFPVNDLQASFRYYVEVLGFEKRWEWGEPPDYGCVAFGNVELFLCQGGQGHAGTWLYLFVDGIDEYTSFIRERGAEILSGPRDEPWGMREIHVRDPDGHILRIGTGLERKPEQ
jgi:catechol 2,3-dioxygenase-like lactoylglutathione lyase family enzyme